LGKFPEQGRLLLINVHGFAIGDSLWMIGCGLFGCRARTGGGGKNSG
jgi:hypothetical protein